MIESSEAVRRVLVVDDDQDAATSMAAFLRAAGYHVETSFDGKAALQTAERFEPDACVLDINMPGMDGYELARRLRALVPHHPPVLAALTAASDDSHLDRAVEAGFDLHFTKPALPRDVAEQMSDCLGQRPAGHDTAAK